VPCGGLFNDAVRQKNFTTTTTTMAYTYPFKGTDENTKLKVWAKGKPIKDFDEKVWRHDTCGKVMKYSEHGNTDSEYGW